MISKEDLIRALDHSTPYPIELDATLMDYMADRLMEFCTVERNESHELWQPEETPEGPVVETPTAPPAPPTGD